MAFLLILLTLIGVWLLSNLLALYNNYRIARTSNLPILIGIGNPDNYIWMVLSVPLRRILEKLLPASFYEKFFQTTIYGWEFRDKNALHKRIGQMFLLVSAGETELWVADPTAAQSVLTRRKDFVQSKIGTKVMETLGPNIITVSLLFLFLLALLVSFIWKGPFIHLGDSIANHCKQSDGEAWARQRRLIAPNLNERISEVVWKESTTQATTMSHHLLSQPKGETKSTLEGLRSIALNVLGQAGYGQTQHWSSSTDVVSEDGKMTVFDAVSRIIPNLIPAAILPTWLLRLGIMPKLLRDIGEAVDDYPGQTNALINKEKALAHDSGEERSNFIAMLARLSDGGGKVDGKSGLSPEEIQGNLFLVSHPLISPRENSILMICSSQPPVLTQRQTHWPMLSRPSPPDPTYKAGCPKS